jgi:5-methylthioadenosine/S-adenosylhomocysteine deaminase
LIWIICTGRLPKSFPGFTMTPKPLNDCVICNGTILTLDPAFTVIPKGFITVDDHRITQIAELADDTVIPPARKVIDAEGGIIMPGLVNTHGHLPMALFRGLADDLPLDAWLNECIFPAEAAHIKPDTVAVGTALSVAEMLLSGTTCCCDGYFLEDHQAETVAETGIRAVLGQGVIDFPAPGVADPKENVAHAAAFVDRWRSRTPLIAPSIFCHSPYTCSAETLRAAKAAADDRGALFQIHAAETQSERSRCIAQHQRTPIHYLDDLGVLDTRTLIAHAVWVDDADIQILARSGARVSHNPESNMKLACGIAPVADMLNAGIRVGLGTDGCASNNNLDLFQEMDTAAKLHKVCALDPTVTDAPSVLKMATIHGAECLGLAHETGSLEPGKQADIIIIDTHRPRLTPMFSPVSQLVYAATGADVRHVLVAGRVLVENQCLTTIDLPGLAARLQPIGKRIMALFARGAF